MAVSEPTYLIQEPDGTRMITRSEILRVFFPWWSEQMTRIGKADQISEDECVQDYVTTHWAWRVDD